MESKIRVVSGQFKGQRLVAPKSGTHPMGAREKLALFNMVDPAGKKVLDTFAGSGALGIEALSRGATEVVFVEKSPAAMRIIRANVDEISAKNHVTFEKLGTFSPINPQNAVRNREKSPKIAFFTQSVARFAKNRDFLGYFDLIIADPSYMQIKIAEIQALVPQLASGGNLILSSPAEQEPSELTGLELVSSRTYARARLTVYTA